VFYTLALTKGAKMKNLLIIFILKILFNPINASEVECTVDRHGRVSLSYNHTVNNKSELLKAYLGTETWDNPTKFRELCVQYKRDYILIEKLVSLQIDCNYELKSKIEIFGLVLFNPKNDKVLKMGPCYQDRCPIIDLTPPFFINHGDKGECDGEGH
jgi:hypothetical protein